jgi:hypothetical protein
LNGIFYLFGLIGFGVIVAWYVANERLKPGEPTVGVLRMRESSEGAQNKPPRPRDRDASRFRPPQK